MQSVLWTPGEDAILKEFYPIEGASVYSRLPGRTKSACYARAHALGLRRDAWCWGAEEDALLRDNYSELGLSGVAELLGRTESAVATRVKVLGVSVGYLNECAHKHGSRDFWTGDEEAILIQNAHLTVPNLQKLLPGRSYKAISLKRSVLGLGSVVVPWTTEELNLLRENSGLVVSELCALLPGRSASAIRSQKMRLGFV